jgi:hypothetical protein
MSARWGTRSGGVSSRKHGIGGYPSPNSRHVQEAVRQLEQGRRKRAHQRMYASVRDLFSSRKGTR